MTRMKILTEAELAPHRAARSRSGCCVRGCVPRSRHQAGGMPPILRLDIPEPPRRGGRQTAYVAGLDGFAIKISPGFFDNPKIGLPSTNGLMVLLSSKTGLVQALGCSHNGYLTDVRTAAQGRSRRNICRGRFLGGAVFGAGMQARLQLEALALVRPIREARIWARDAAKAETAATAFAGKLGFPIKAENRSESGHRRLPTSSSPRRRPRRRSSRPNGSSRAARHGHGFGRRTQERTGPACDRRATYVADSLKQTRRLGELHHAIAAHLVSAEAEFPELGQVIAGLKPGRTRRRTRSPLPT